MLECDETAHKPQSFASRRRSSRRITVVEANGNGWQIAGVEQSRLSLGVFGMTPIMRDGKSVAPSTSAQPSARSSSIGPSSVSASTLPCPDGGTIKTLSSTFGDQAVATADELKGIFDGAPLHRDATLNGDPAALYARQIKNYAWQPIAILETIMDTTGYEVAAARSQRNLIFGTVAILIAAGLVALFLGRGISRPLVSITAIMNRLSSDDIDVAIPGGERLDEIGTMAQAVDVFRRSVMEARTLREALESDKEKNELETRALRRQMADRFESEVKSVVGAVAKATEDMRGVAGEITSSVNDTSDRRSGRRVGRGLGKRRRGCGGDR